MWKRLGDVARACPEVSSKEETIDMWLDSWHSAMAELQDLDCKTESARLRPVKPSPFLEKLILDVHKKCKHLEDPLRGWDDELIPNFNKKPPPSSRPDAAESSTNQTGNKGKHSLHWCLGGIPSYEGPMAFHFPAVPGGIPPSPPPLLPIRHCRRPTYPPSCPPSPPSFPSYVLSRPPPCDSNTNSNKSSPTASPAPKSAESSPRWIPSPIIVPPPKEQVPDIRTPDSSRTRPYHTPIPFMPPPEIYSPPYYPPTALSERELILLIEDRQRDIEVTQLEISRKQSEMNRAVADITGWLVELRHKKDGA